MLLIGFRLVSRCEMCLLSKKLRSETWNSIYSVTLTPPQSVHVQHVHVAFPQISKYFKRVLSFYIEMCVVVRGQSVTTTGDVWELRDSKHLFPSTISQMLQVQSVTLWLCQRLVCKTFREKKKKFSPQKSPGAGEVITGLDFLSSTKVRAAIPLL